ncbi:DUF6473 family protein [Oceanicola sp. S124]|uniref:DUF6473 family protein n=1 Tax=Oceanicola sp. S124 TaxID=1042378 RepID=UPI0002559F1C|nr:DUF6473 family protein [Oceanicola sp. S124]
MSFDQLGRGGLDYFPCRYGQSKTLFRGPRRRIDGDFIAFLGGAETYGKFIAHPYPAILEERLGLPAVNLGWANAGVDAFLCDPDLLRVVAQARVAVIRLPGAQNMSNRFYAVHPRRNDRFLQASTLLQTVYREVDFTEFHFTGHLLGSLRAQSRDRFAMLREELQQAWVARMGQLLDRIPVPVLLLWFADHEPGAPDDEALDRDPLFVTREMLAALTDRVNGLVTCVPSPSAQAEGTAGMIFSAMEAPAAAEQLSSAAHGEVAEALAEPLKALLTSS